jgi:hypothetical protein
LASICWAIWKVRNRACFKKYIYKKPRGNYLCCLFFYAIFGRFLFGGLPENDQFRRGTDGEDCTPTLGKARRWNPGQGDKDARQVGDN